MTVRLEEDTELQGLEQAVLYVTAGVDVWTGTDRTDGEALFDRLRELRTTTGNATLTIELSQRELKLALRALDYMINECSEGECSSVLGVTKADIVVLKNHLAPLATE